RTLKAWLLHSYGEAIADPGTLRSAFLTNSAYTGLLAPVQETAPGLFVPDLKARYLSEDVPFGLVASRNIAQLAGVETPVMDEVIAWAGEKLGKDYLDRDMQDARIPQRYGLNTIEELVAFAKA
ncbi:MAG: NAD/NADP octopine/nopaline dehydrogenase family protein, partial [Anaerolineales bacterium]|nr:NAD/NADP octopine/nopaline dehydrogenase family protein [Anaerolineales bacterium]